MTSALVLGSNGQDGVLLCQSLLARGYSVVGVGRQSKARLPFEGQAFGYCKIDLESELASLSQLLVQHRPDLVFHFAAVHGSAERSRYETVFDRMLAVNVASLHAALEYLRLHNPSARLLYASSAKVFGTLLPANIDERTGRASDCLYALTKNAAGDAIRYYRREHNCNASQIFLFNHESEYRPTDFFMPKLARAVARAMLGHPASECFASLGFHCDWGVAEEYMDIAIDCLERAPGEDFTLASGRCLSARQLVEQVFAARGLASCSPVAETAGNRGQPPYAVSTAKLAALVGRTPMQPIEALLDRLIEMALARLSAAHASEAGAPRSQGRGA